GRSGHARDRSRRPPAPPRPAPRAGRAAARTARNRAAAPGAGAESGGDRRGHRRRPRNREVAPALRHGQAAGGTRRPRRHGDGHRRRAVSGPDHLDPAERALADALAGTRPAGAPSPDLDARILASARAAAAPRAAQPDVAASAAGSAGAPASARSSGRRRHRRPAWLRGGAVAASLVVAIGVAWQLRPQYEAPQLAGDAAPAQALSKQAPPPASAADG